MPVYLICTGLLGLLYAALSLNVARMRGRKRVSLGDGGDAELQDAIRAHANFMEYVPLCLFLIYMLQDYYGFRTIAGLSVGLLGARVLHATGMLGYLKRGRMFGAIGTTAILVICAVWIGLLGLRIRLY